MIKLIQWEMKLMILHLRQVTSIKKELTHIISNPSSWIGLVSESRIEKSL